MSKISFGEIKMSAFGRSSVVYGNDLGDTYLQCKAGGTWLLNTDENDDFSPDQLRQIADKLDELNQKDIDHNARDRYRERVESSLPQKE